MLQLVQFVHSPVHPSDPSFCLTRLTRPTRPSIRLPTFRTFRTFRTAAPLRLELLKLNDITFSPRRNSEGTPKELYKSSKENRLSGCEIRTPQEFQEENRSSGCEIRTPKEFQEHNRQRYNRLTDKGATPPDTSHSTHSHRAIRVFRQE